MSDDDGERAGPSSSFNFQEGYISPISAADMLNRSRRTPRRTTTPTRKLFPDNIDLVAPGMTPTSRSRPKRKSTLGARTPRKSSSRLVSSSTKEQPSQTRLQDVFSDGGRTTSRLRSDQDIATPRATPGNRSLPESDVSVSRGKRKARESVNEESVSLVANQFGGWGSGREESPMELLRRLVAAPGRLQSPSESGDDTMQSISQRLQNGDTSSLKPGLSASGDLTREMPPPISRPSNSNRDRVTASRFSVANTSMAASEAGQGRRTARQSQVANLFSDLLSNDDTSENQSIDQTTGKRSDFPLPEGISESQEEISMDQDEVERSLEQADRDESSLIEGMADTTAAASVKRFEDIETSIESTRSHFVNGEDNDFNEEQDEEERNESDVFKTRNLLAQSPDTEEAPQIEDSGNVFDLDNDQEFPTYEDEEEEIESDSLLDEAMPEPGQEMTESSDEEGEDDLIDQSKALQTARLALLRKRRSKKKAKRYSSISGNLVPCLPSASVKSAFVSSVMPKTGFGLAQQSKGKIVVDKAAAEAVEDLTHHFFAQFMQSLVSQADEKSQSTISERDILALLKSQGQISARNSLSFLARKHLPRELSDLVTSTTAASEAASARKQTSKRQTKAISIVEDSRIEEDEEDEDKDEE